MPSDLRSQTTGEGLETKYSNSERQSGDDHDRKTFQISATATPGQVSITNVNQQMYTPMTSALHFFRERQIDGASWKAKPQPSKLLNVREVQHENPSPEGAVNLMSFDTPRPIPHTYISNGASPQPTFLDQATPARSFTYRLQIPLPGGGYKVARITTDSTSYQIGMIIRSKATELGSEPAEIEDAVEKFLASPTEFLIKYSSIDEGDEDAPEELTEVIQACQITMPPVTDSRLPSSLIAQSNPEKVSEQMDPYKTSGTVSGSYASPEDDDDNELLFMDLMHSIANFGYSIHRGFNQICRILTFRPLEPNDLDRVRRASVIKGNSTTGLKTIGNASTAGGFLDEVSETATLGSADTVAPEDVTLPVGSF